MKGKIVYYKKENGYGFIESPKHEKNVFFHIKNIFKSSVDDIQVNKEVSFDVEHGEKGLNAIKVQIL